MLICARESHNKHRHERTQTRAVSHHRRRDENDQHRPNGRHLASPSPTFHATSAPADHRGLTRADVGLRAFRSNCPPEVQPALIDRRRCNGTEAVREPRLRSRASCKMVPTPRRSDDVPSCGLVTAPHAAGIPCTLADTLGISWILSASLGMRAGDGTEPSVRAGLRVALRQRFPENTGIPYPVLLHASSPAQTIGAS